MMADFYDSRPAANPVGHNLGADDIVLHRQVPSEQPLELTGVVGGSWALTRDNLFETVGGLLLQLGLVYGVQMLVGTAIYMVVLVIAFAGMAAGEALGNEALGGALMMGGMGFAYLAMMMMLLVVNVLGHSAYQLFWLRLIRGQKTSLADLKVIKRHIVPLLASTLLTTMAVMGGSLLLLVPGVILALGFTMTTFVIMDKNLPAVEAMRASWRLMQGHKLSFFLLGLLLMAVNMAGMLTCGVGLLITIPISIGATVLYYDRIAAPGNAYLS